MTQPPAAPGTRPPVRHPVMLGVAIALVATNLRPALASVGPVLNDVQADLGLSGVEASLLTAVPVICLGALAWQVALFFGLQALSFYAVLAWLPSIYQDHGFSPAAAGLLLSVSALVQIPITLLLPHFAARVADQRAFAAGCTALTAAGLAGVLVAPTAAPYLWVVVLGIGQGGTFAVGLLMFVLRARTTADTARLSAMAQMLGYLIAGAGPLLVGTVHDVTASWKPAVLLLLALLVPQLVFGVLAGRRRHVGGGR